MIEELSVQFPILECCAALSVSRSGYYQWAGVERSLRAESNVELLKQIEQVYREHKGTLWQPADYPPASARGRWVQRESGGATHA